MVVAEVIQAVELGLPLPKAIVDKSHDFRFKNVAALHLVDQAQTPLAIVEALLSHLFEAGMPVEEIFRAFRTDKNEIDRESLHVGLVKMNCVLSIEELEEVIEVFDGDGDAKISQLEWINFMDEKVGSHQEQLGVLLCPRDIAMAKWKDIETTLPEITADSIIILEELSALSQVPGLRAMFNKWDIGSDGNLTKSDIQKGLAADISRTCDVISGEGMHVIQENTAH
jgi:Ca2+-binding EF-hand superfamily protein